MAVVAALPLASSPAGAVGGGYGFSGRVAGYRLTPPSSSTYASVDFVLPTVTCAPGDTYKVYGKTAAGAVIFPGISRKGSGAGITMTCNFGALTYTIDFSALTISDAPVTPPQRSRIVDASHTVEAKAGALSPGGDAFTALWISSCSPDAQLRC